MTTTAEPLPGSKRATRAKREETPRSGHAPDAHRMLPASEDAEKGLLCSFLLAPLEVGGLCAEKRVAPGHFHLPAHATVYSVLVEMWDKSRAIDVVTLTQELHDRRRHEGAPANLLTEVGGPGYVSQLFTFLPTAANASYYVEIVQEKHTLREIIRSGTEYASRAYEEQDNVPGLLGEYEARVLAVAEARSQVKELRMKALVIAAVGGIQEMYERRGETSGLATGFRGFDQMTDGLQRKELVVIAARPSMGKTAFAMNIAEHLALEEKRPVAVFSLEMGAQQLVQRLLCSRAKINLQRLRDGFLAERDFPALTAAAARLAEAPVYVDDTSGLTILELKARARRLKSQHGIEAVFVDYIQLLKSTSRKAADNRQIEIAEISSGLKELAKELDLPVVALAQLNRSPEQRDGGRPRLSDLRESGSIEQDADLVGLLVREEYYAESDEAKKASEGKATLIIAKQRNGPVGDVALTFRKELTRFEDRKEEEAEG